MGSVVNSERLPNIVHLAIGTQAATITLPGPYVRKHSRLKYAHIIDQAGLVTGNTNYVTFSLQDLAANVYATYDTRAAGQGALVANTAGQMVDTSVSDSASQPEVDIPAGTQLVLVVTAGGTVTTTKAICQLELYPL